jgi:hypothetical protein
MAEQPLVEDLADAPDVAKLKQLEVPIVVVTKISPTGKKTANQLVVNGATGMSWQEILNLHDQLPAGVIPNSGPGLYKFKVTDQNTTATVSWQVRLGAGTNDGPIQNEVARSPFPTGAVPVPQAVMAAAPVLRPVPLSPDAQNMGNGWVYNPSMEVLTAPNGEMFPWRKGMTIPTMTQPVVTTTAPAVAQATTFQSSTAVNPEFEAMRQMLTATQAALAEVKEREKEAARQAEIRALQEQMQKSLEDSNKRFEALVATLAKPERNSEIEELKRQIAEKDRIDSLRAEMKAQADNTAALLREATAHKGPDPMIGVLTEMLKDQRHAADENTRAMRELMTAERLAARETTLTPEKLLTMLERQAMLNKDDSKSEMASKMFSSFDMLMERMMKITQMEREMGSAGGGMDWASMIREVGGRASGAIQMYMQAKAREAEAAKATAAAQVATAQAKVVEARTQTALAKRAAPAPTHPRTSEELAAAAAAGRAAQATNPPPPAGKRARMTIVQPKLAELSLADLRMTFKKEPDELFFGGFFEYVTQLRDELANKAPGEVSVQEVVNYILEARSFIAQEIKAGNVTHAAEIFIASQYTYLLERLLPAVNEGFRSEIVKLLAREIQAEIDAARVAAASAPPKPVGVAPVETPEETAEVEEPATPEEPAVS